MKHHPKYYHHDIHQKNANVKEINKTAEITDIFNNLRYRVYLTSFNDINSEKYPLVYQIQVINYGLAPAPLLVFERPEFGQREITDYKKAVSIYDECIKNYSSLVNAETRDFQDIHTMKDAIGYTVTIPECCGTCYWSKTQKTPHDHIVNVTGQLKCVHPMNQPTFNEKNNVHIYDDNKVFLNPKVDVFGFCPKYEVKKATIPYTPIPGDSINDIINRQVTTTVHTIISDPPIIEGNDDL